MKTLHIVAQFLEAIYVNLLHAHISLLNSKSVTTAACLSGLYELSLESLGFLRALKYITQTTDTEFISMIIL